MALIAPQAHLPEVPGESPHYVRAITELGDEREVIAHDDVYASNGMKLIAKGARIGSHQFERLTQHKLLVPLDKLMNAERPVDAAFLSTEADKIIENNALYRRIVSRSGDPRAVKHGLAGLSLPSELLLRLTVMRERRNDIYLHALRCAIIAFALAQRSRTLDKDGGALLLAALCHDVGEMHTDPSLLAIGHDITPQERRFVHVHPVTGYVLLHDMRGLPSAAAQAVLHHHERLDGSGYPNDVPAARIPPLARLVAVADVAEAVIRRYDLQRLDMLFRLNQHRFDSELVRTLRDLLHISPQDAHATPSEYGAASQLAHLADLLQAWFTLRDMLEQQIKPQHPSASPLAFLFERMGTIRSLVLQAGFDPDNMASMLAIARDDPDILLELREMLDEMDWLLRDLANEIDRRSAELAGLSPGALTGLLGHLRPTLHH